MRKFLVIMTAAMIPLLFTKVIRASEHEFQAILSGAAEVPPVSTTTDGWFRLEYDATGDRAKFTLGVENSERITQAHLHCAPEGQNGPVVAFLAGFHDRGWDVDGQWIGNAVLTDSNIIADAICPETIETLGDLIRAMRNENIYVNIHSVANPGGVIRGQIRSIDTSLSRQILITHYYTSILGREPDAGGLAFWDNQITEKQAQGLDVKPVFREMAIQFFNSPEYLGNNTNNTEFITDLYRTFFQREPDNGGITFWSDQLALGVTRDAVIDSFLHSPEFTAFMQSLGF